jgi:tRNA(Ile)-lysidine synthase TilS/MesJ
MLQIPRAEIMEYIGLRGTPYIEDSSNRVLNQSRYIIRHTIIPRLKEINPGFTRSVAVTSDLIRQDEEYLTGLAGNYIKSQESYKESKYFYLESLNSLPLPVKIRVFKLIGGKKLSYRHVSAILDLCGAGKPSRFIMLPGMVVRRNYDKIYFFLFHVE